MHATDIVGWTGNAEVYCADCKPDCATCKGKGEVSVGYDVLQESERLEDCPDCDGGKGDGVDGEGNEYHPIFASDEGWTADYCANCHEPLDPDGEDERKMAAIRARVTWVIEARDSEACPECGEGGDGEPREGCETCGGIGEVDGGCTVHAYCGTIVDAEAVKADVQSLCGSNVEGDADFLYCIVDNGDEAAEELRDAGYQTDMSMA